MGDPFLCLLKPHCFTFSSSSSSLLPSHGSFLHNKLRPRSPLRFPKPRPETTTLPHSSSSQFVLISTTECSDGSVVFRFGDESEKAAFDEANRILEAELAEESNVERSEVDASPEENAVIELTTAVLGDSSPSTDSQDVFTQGESHSRDVPEVSTPRVLESHTLGSERYSSTISGEKLREDEALRKDDTRGSTPMPVESHASEGSEAYLSTKAEGKLTVGKEDRPDVIGASTPSPVEMHTSEGSEGYPSTKAKDEVAEGKEDRPDVLGAPTPAPVELHTSKDSEGYSSTKSEDELAAGKGDQTDITGASTPVPMKISTSEGTESFPSTKTEVELTEGKEHRRDVTGASILTPVKFEGSEGFTKSGDKFTEEKEHRTNVSGASTPRTVELLTVESSERYPSTKSKDEFIEGKAHRGDVSGALTERTEGMPSVEAFEEDAPINCEAEFADGKTHIRESSGKLVPQTVEAHSVEDTNGYPLTKTEDESTEGEERRDVSGESNPRTLELHIIEGTKDIKLEDDFAEGKVDRTDVLEAATPRTVELHTVAEDTPSKKSEDEFTGDKAHKRNVSGATTPVIVESLTVEEVEGEDISASLLRLSTGAAILPHPSKALSGGEDAYFLASGNWLGVADGVSQWSLEGIYSGVYARELMENCERFLSNCKGITLTKPEDVLVRVAGQTKSPGSSTVLIAYFDGQAFHVANIGNSGFIIIRNGTVFKRSSPLIHGFNFPLQIVRGVDPSELIERYSIDLDEEDVIVTATDGLFDNLYEQEIASIVTKSFQRRMKLEDIAKFLATSAQEVGQSTSRRSPFADAVETSGYVGYTGGKLDDVTVLVSHVHKKSSF